MSILEIVIYSVLGALVIGIITYNIIKKIRSKDQKDEDEEL